MLQKLINDDFLSEQERLVFFLLVYCLCPELELYPNALFQVNSHHKYFEVRQKLKVIYMEVKEKLLIF